MPTNNSATTSTTVTTSTTNIISTGPASALGNTGSTGILGTASSVLQTLYDDLSLPLPNVLSTYATYTYVLGIRALSTEEYNFPDANYMAGKFRQNSLICMSANSRPNDRVNTIYGKFDFFIDDVTIENIIGFNKNANSNISNIAFSIIEPYSLGILMLALQTAANEAGHTNWRDAPYLLSIEFRGNTQAGQMVNIPNTARYIPFKFANVLIKASQSGTRYDFTAIPYNVPVLGNDVNKTKSDVALKGKTVQEVLQSGPKSLQAVINARLKQFKDDGIVSVQDEVLIIFPNDEYVPSSATPTAASGNVESPGSATISTATPGSMETITSKLGVTRSDANQTLVQTSGQCNVLGKATTGYSANRKGDVVFGDENAVYNSKTGTWTLGSMTYNSAESSYKFSQDSTITNIINQVLLTSDYPTEALNPANLSQYGMVNWWRIDVQQFIINSSDNLDKTGTFPRIHVYRVIPYGAHTSRAGSVNVQSPGFNQIKNHVIKQYDYIYTGKNTEVKQFDIDFSMNFSWVIAADNFARSQDVKTESATGDDAPATDPNAKIGSVITPGQKPSTDPGNIPGQRKPGVTQTSSDKKGGGGSEDISTRAARTFQDAITNELDMVNLNMTIAGDPYWVAHSGLGNYTSKLTKYKDLNDDGTVNYQNSEVDILVNFRTPIDINQATGLYDFGGTSSSAPVIHFSGLYAVSNVVSTFRKGNFEQILKGYRRPQQENKNMATDGQFGFGGFFSSISNFFSSIGKIL